SSAAPGPFASISGGTWTVHAAAGVLGVNTFSLASGTNKAYLPGASISHVNGFTIGFGVNMSTSGDIWGAGSGSNILNGNINAAGVISSTMTFGNTVASESGAFSFGVR